MATNKKPRKAYRPKPVTSFMQSDFRRDIEIMAFYMAPKMAAGLFDNVDGNTLAYLLNISRRMAVEYGNDDMLTVVDRALNSFFKIRERKDRLDKWGATGDQLIDIEETLPVIAKWLLNQPLHRIELAKKFVLKVNAQLIAEGALFADVKDNGDLENIVKKGVEHHV